MSAPRPFFNAATAQQIDELARQGFATALQIASPPRELLIYRTDRETGRSNVVITDTFRVKHSNVQAQGGGDDGASRTAVAGTISRFLPTLADGRTADPAADRLKAGDRFVLPESGPCIVQSLQPDRFGVERAEYTLEQGSA